ncbi:MAG: Ig-like domain-containing protein, partial [Ignavibacteriales bacterium]|nr:Ig-like domain-containing protein [Ignavibacteriales bacterium]
MKTHATSRTNVLGRYARYLGVPLKVAMTAALLSVVFMAGCKDDTIVGICDTTAPFVISTDPVNNATGVAFAKMNANTTTSVAHSKIIAKNTTGKSLTKTVANTAADVVQIITVTFSETMDASTITTASFTLMQGSTYVAGTVSCSNAVATFVPGGNLLPNTIYTGTITTSVKDLAGNSLASSYVWSFTTQAAAVVIPPTVSFTDPANNATGVGFNKKIAATFSDSMNASTITTASFTLMQGSTFVAGTVSYVGTTAIYSPSSNLAPNTTYTATITTSIKDLAGIAMASNYVWSFTTGAAAVIIPPTVTFTDPANNATGVGFNKKIAATFSETMDASTITTATFTLMQGTTFVSGTVSYVGTTAIYSPTSNLAPSTTYTATITTSAKDLAGIAMVSNYVWSFTTGAAAVIIPPTVTLTDPVNAATGVGFNKKIAATFSETMDATTITTASFTLMQGSTFVSGTVSYSGTTAIYSPSSNLAPSTTYTATITTSAKDLAGIAMVSNYVWSFTTGAAAVIIPPTVTLTDPVNAATGVGFNKKIAATFSETMDASTITTATFTLMQGTTFVAGTVSYSGVTAIYSPTSNLAPSTIYTATITTSAKDLAGIAMVSNYVWSFTTGAAAVIIPPTVTLTDPLNIATGVGFNKKIAATFSETMDASTITTATFTLMQGTTFVAGTVSYSGVTAIYSPTSNLAPSTTYTATITTSAKDLAGIAMVSNYVWSFTTGAAAVIIPPTVTLTDPLNNATGVGFNKKIAATFSETMDATTITTA